MGHITIVGPSMNKVKEHLNLLLERENVGGHSTGFLFLSIFSFPPISF